MNLCELNQTEHHAKAGTMSTVEGSTTDPLLVTLYATCRGCEEKIMAERPGDNAAFGDFVLTSSLRLGHKRPVAYVAAGIEGTVPFVETVPGSFILDQRRA